MELLKPNVYVYKLSDWFVTDESDFKAQAPKRRCLSGKRDGDYVRTTTSPIVEYKGRVVVTQSGSIYILAAIDTSFIKYIQENNIEYDYENPITAELLEATRNYRSYMSYSQDSSRGYDNRSYYGGSSNSAGGYSSSSNWQGSYTCPFKGIKPKEKSCGEI